MLEAVSPCRPWWRVALSCRCGPVLPTAATMSKVAILVWKKFTATPISLASASIAASGTWGIIKFRRLLPWWIYGILTQTNIGHSLFAGCYSWVTGLNVLYVSDYVWSPYCVLAEAHEAKFNRSGKSISDRERCYGLLLAFYTDYGRHFTPNFHGNGSRREWCGRLLHYLFLCFQKRSSIVDFKSSSFLIRLHVSNASIVCCLAPCCSLILDCFFGDWWVAIGIGRTRFKPFYQLIFRHPFCVSYIGCVMDSLAIILIWCAVIYSDCYCQWIY